jgi:hypothetical protein
VSENGIGEAPGLQEELRQRHEAFESGLKALRDDKQRIEVEAKRLVEMIAVGNGSPAVMAAITERETRLREITNQDPRRSKKNSMS